MFFANVCRLLHTHFVNILIKVNWMDEVKLVKGKNKCTPVIWLLNVLKFFKRDITGRL